MTSEPSDSESTPEDDRAIGDYLRRVYRAAWYLPRPRREQIAAQITERIVAETHADGTAAEVSAVLARLGRPRDAVRAADGHCPGAGAGWAEYVAVILLLIGGLALGIGWAVGVVLLWASPRWRWTDKLAGTLIWPGGLLITRLLMERYTLSTLIANGIVSNGPGAGSFRFVLDSTLGHPPLRHLAVLLLAGLPPILVAIGLLLRARKPAPLASDRTGATPAPTPAIS